MLRRLFDDMIDFSQMEARTLELKPGIFDPAELAKSVVRLMRHQAKARQLSLELDLVPGTPPAMIADPDRLRQILVNLISNAIKFTETGGVILRVAPVPIAPAQTALRFSVSDTGAGLTPAMQARLFESFSPGETQAAGRDKPEGMGLGLAICDRLVKLMGGRIGVDSVPGQGSTFWFLLPGEPGADTLLGAFEPGVQPLPEIERLVDHAHLYEIERALGVDAMRDHLVAALENILGLLRRIEAAGQRVHFDYLTGTQVQQAQPGLSHEVRAAVAIQGQKYIHPPQFMRALTQSFIARGGKLREWVRVEELNTEPNAVWLTDNGGHRHRHDAVVLATGATLGALARPFGVTKVVQAGRGYSFTVTGSRVPSGPVYFPNQRIACTPLHEPVHPVGEPPYAEEDTELLRVAGMMEFRRPGEPLDQRRIRAIVETLRPLLAGLDLDRRRTEWVGARPCTSDGLPLIGGTTDRRVFVAGGHGMWGVALGPVTGKLLAEQVVTGLVPDELAPFDPLR